MKPVILSAAPTIMTITRLPLLAFLLTTTTAWASDWPEFRGPTGQGHYAEGSLPTKWGEKENIAWKKPIPGNGWSSPIVVQGKIYLTTAVPLQGSVTGDHSLRALCLDAKTGHIEWNKEVFRQESRTAPRVHTKNSHASPTPICDGEKLYVHFGHQGTACLDLKGKVLWRNRDLTYKPVHGNGGSPILVEDKLVFSVDGGDQRFVAALYRDSGKLAWKHKRLGSPKKSFSFGTPLLIEVNGEKQIICPGSDLVEALEPREGNVIWYVRYDGYSLVPRPVYGNGLIYLSTGYDRPELLAIRPDGKGDVTDTHIAWRTNRGVSNTPSFLLVDKELYMVSDSGVASCWDAVEGKELWKRRLGGNFSASPLFAAGHLYFQNEEGEGIVLAAGKTYQEVQRNKIQGRTLASYAAGDGVLFLRSEGYLYRIGK
jgi:outer membrane protein assembly factor BamB